MTRLANRLLLDEAFRGQFAAFNSFIASALTESTVVGSQGISVGGEGAVDVRIHNNTIEDVMEGIQVGLSRRNDNTRLLSRTVTIEGNTISILLTAVSLKRDRHAIFVGNCDSLLIENNRALITRLPTVDRLDIDGIRVWGELGDRALVTRNHLASADGDRDNSFTVGINMQPLDPIDFLQQLWLVNFNVAPSRQQTVIVSNGAEEEKNYPQTPS